MFHVYVDRISDLIYVMYHYNQYTHTITQYCSDITYPCIVTGQHQVTQHDILVHVKI